MSRSAQIATKASAGGQRVSGSSPSRFLVEERAAFEASETKLTRALDFGYRLSSTPLSPRIQRACAACSSGGKDDEKNAALAEITRKADFSAPAPALSDGALHVSDPSEPEELAADRFADAAMKLIAEPLVAKIPNAAPVAPQTLAPLTQAAPAPDISREPAPAPETHAEREEAPEPDAQTQSRTALAPGGSDGEDPHTSGDPLDRLFGASVGLPLSSTVRERIEPLVGVDLGRVRIHADAEAEQLTDRFQARAFAHQKDIFFAPGEFSPGTSSGMHLLLHEIAHVVQQAGERRPSRKIARAPRGALLGTTAHNLIEDTLIEEHSNLIKEAVLPSGNRDGTDLHKIGFPDLYRSSSGNKVPWVRGQLRDDGTLKYVPIKLGRRKHPRSKGGKSEHEPTVDAKEKFTGDFPTEFAVAEIKPIGLTPGGKLLSATAEKVGEGLAQSSNYFEGFPKFAEQAKKDGKSSVIPTAKSLTTEQNLLPAAIDYRNFASESQNLKPAKPKFVVGDRRIWVYPLQKRPVLYYFDLPHPYAASDYTRALDAVFSELEGLKRTLGQQQSPAKISGKRRSRVRRRARILRKRDWKADHAKWEQKRHDWDEKKARPYLKTDAAKAVNEKKDIDSKLGLPASHDPEGAQRARKFRQVELFSGKTGKILGQIRYALAPVFEKVGPFFEWLKKKFQKLIGKLSQKRALSLSWAQTIFNAVIKALGTTVQEAIWLLFGMFQDCIIGMIENFIEGFTKDLTDELEKPFEEGKQAFFNWLGVDELAIGQLIKDVEASLQKYEAIIDEVMNVKRLVDEIRIYEFAIRGIVQAISCATPPLLGCLWGAVAQLALPAMVDLAMTSDLFQNRVVRPLVRDLVRDILDEPFSRIVSASIEAIGLGKWAQHVPACKIKPIDVKKIIDQAIEPGLKLDDPELLKLRDAWNKKHEGEILDAAAKQFVKKDGKPVTKEELKALMEQTKDLLPSAGGMKDALDKAKRADGKIDYDKFADWARGKVAAKPKGAGQGGFTTDNGSTPSGGDVKAKLDGIELSNVAPGRLVELLEDSRDDEGKVNVDQFARKVTKHLERQQIKRDVEAKLPDMPGVPKQPGVEFTDPSGNPASKDDMRELVESLAIANLGEQSGAGKVEAQRGPDRKVDPKAVKSAVDAAASGLPSGAGAAEGSGGDAKKAQPKEPPKKPSGEPERCEGPLCITKTLPDTGGPKIGPFDVGPQKFGTGESETVVPGISIPLPEFGGKKKK